MLKRKPKILTPEQAEEIRTKDFFDLILPGTIKFLSDHYIVGDSYRCVWAIREYPPSTEEQAILSQLADRRAEDKTNSNALILGNSGQGKSYLLKLILPNIRESGKRIICLDPESEYET